jgi:hypothetical protein
LRVRCSKDNLEQDRVAGKVAVPGPSAGLEADGGLDLADRVALNGND